jgi:hypothetical protein
MFARTIGSNRRAAENAAHAMYKQFSWRHFALLVYVDPYSIDYAAQFAGACDVRAYPPSRPCCGPRTYAATW